MPLSIQLVNLKRELNLLLVFGRGAELGLSDQPGDCIHWRRTCIQSCQRPMDLYGRLDSRLHPREAGIFRSQVSIPERLPLPGLDAYLKAEG